MARSFRSDTRVWDELRRKIGTVKDAHVKVGVLESHGGGNSAGGVTLAELAAIHEFGAPKAGIPSRSFLRNTFTGENREALVKTITKLAKAVVNKKLEVGPALEQLGTWAVAAVKRRIKEHIPPPLKQATIDHKKSSTPLVDTGVLLNSITHEVKR